MDILDPYRILFLYIPRGRQHEEEAKESQEIKGADSSNFFTTTPQ
jgi:lipoprotein NlpI